MDQVVFDYLNPKVPAGLRLVDVPLVRAESLYRELLQKKLGVSAAGAGTR